MNWSADTQKICRSLIEQLSLPHDFETVVRDIYLPLAKIIIDKKQDQPLLVSINGAQGTGKSTLTRFLKHIIESQLSCHVAELSLDDFYSSRSRRQQLGREVHPLFVTRGVPGTHDAALIENILDALMNRQPCTAPRFDKASDERCAESEWVVYREPVNVILFEGWCNQSPVQSLDELVNPVNELESSEDAEGIWRHYANEQLINYHERFFSYADISIMLNAVEFERIYAWRSLQEKKLRQAVSASTSATQQQHIMDDKQLKRFIQHYERISRHTLAHLPHSADMVLPIAADHSITGIVQNHV
ncbi:MAG: phosphoribulokinase [Gammaproteobacteria bacterium]